MPAAAATLDRCGFRSRRGFGSQEIRAGCPPLPQVIAEGLGRCPVARALASTSVSRKTPLLPLRADGGCRAFSPRRRDHVRRSWEGVFRQETDDPPSSSGFTRPLTLASSSSSSRCQVVKDGRAFKDNLAAILGRMFIDLRGSDAARAQRFGTILRPQREDLPRLRVAIPDVHGNGGTVVAADGPPGGPRACVQSRPPASSP